MPTPWPWIERDWSFPFPPGKYPDIVERLRFLADRCERRTRGLEDHAFIATPLPGWSIQEHIGHLADLDALFATRLDEYESGAAEMSPADMSNTATEMADHNARPITEVLDRVRATRGAIVTRLDGYAESMWARTCRHPRTGVTMRLVDIISFKADHDDYHLAQITRLRHALGRP